MTTHMPADRAACPRWNGRRPGLTIIELLVVIAVIAILCGILLPAVLQARSASRTAACANNLRQLAAAVQQYHERNESMPSYWGSNYGRADGVYGGWLTHLMPDLDQQPFYDALVAASKNPIRWYLAPTGNMIPAVPASSDFQPGTWVDNWVDVPVQVPDGFETVTDYLGVTIEVQKYKTVIQTQNYPILVGRVGTPAEEARQEFEWRSETLSRVTTGVPQNLGGLQSQLSLPLLNCLDDPSPTGPGEKVAINIDGTPGADNWSLTNYQASAHAFVKFGPVTPVSATYQRGAGGRILSTSQTGATMGGRFPRPDRFTGATPRDFHPREVMCRLGASISSPDDAVAANSLLPRRFGHLLDGLSNTILFGEGMRQCDGTNSYRIALLPAGSIGNEHTFGIEPTVLSRTNPALNDAIAASYGGFGNTLMFQTRPGTSCNTFRLQANHADALNVAMADGSVRRISSVVSRRELVDPDVAGRSYGLNEYGDNSYNARGMGGLLVSGSSAGRDGVWDMLLMPTDGVDGNVLTNTGEIGNEGD